MCWSSSVRCRNWCEDLTGYESTFSRSGVYFLANPMFIMLVLARHTGAV